MKRVLYHYSHGHYDTGSPRALVAMIDLLDRSRYTPLYLPGSPGVLVETLGRRGVTILPGPPPRSVSPRIPVASAQGLFRQRAQLRAQAIDLVHLNEFGWNLDLVLAAWSAHVPVILHVHNPQFVHRHNLHRWIARYVLIPSEGHRERVEGAGEIRNKLRVFYNPVDFGVMAGGRSIRGELDLAPDAVVVVTVAQICHRKGIDILVELAERTRDEFPGAVFLVVGGDSPAESDYVSAVRGMISDRGLNGRVRLLGSRDDVPDILASSDIFLFPTRAEPFGIAVLEAMAAGLPVIASAVGGVPEILSGPDIGILVQEVTPGGFAPGLRELLSDGDLRRQMGERGRAHSSAAFGREVLASRLHDLYDEATQHD